MEDSTTIEIDNYKIIISKERKTEYSFLAAIMPALPIPEYLEKIHGTVDEITECVIITASRDEESGKYGYMHFEKGSHKMVVGEALAEACVPLETWVWCELFE